MLLTVGIVLSCCVWSFFIGFYSQLLLKILLDILKAMQGLIHTENAKEMQKEINEQVQNNYDFATNTDAVHANPTPGKVNFVEPMDPEMWKAIEEEERREAIRNRQ